MENQANSRDLHPSVAEGRRIIPLEGAQNFRDLGGYPAQSGGYVRWGKVFRSAHLHKVTANDQEQLAALGIQAVVDLRTREERILEPSAWHGSPARLYESGKDSTASLLQGIRENAGSEDSAITFMTSYYANRPTAFSDEYRAMFEMLADGQLPMLIHCTAGKDRTGTACALLLTALGVPRAIVVEDYVLTSKLLPAPGPADPGAALPIGGNVHAEDEKTVFSPAARAALWHARPVYIEAALDSVDRDFGSIEGYLSEGLGLSAAQIEALGELVER